MTSETLSYSWIELRPLQSFEDKFHIKSILEQVEDFAVFFIRQDSTTKIFVRVNQIEETLFTNIEDVEPAPIEEPNFEFEHIRRMQLSQLYHLPLVLTEQRSQLFHLLEEYDSDCIIACYFRREHNEPKRIWKWVSKQEKIYSGTTKASSKVRETLSRVKEKIKDTNFFRSDIFIGINDESNIELLKMALPKEYQKIKTVKQVKSKFSLSKFKISKIEEKFDFTNYQIKMSSGSRVAPVLNSIEITSIISLPEDVSRYRLHLGSVLTYSQGPTASIFDTDIIVPNKMEPDNDLFVKSLETQDDEPSKEKSTSNESEEDLLDEPKNNEKSKFLVDF